MRSCSGRVKRRPGWLFTLIISVEIMIIWGSSAQARPFSTQAQVGQSLLSLQANSTEAAAATERVMREGSRLGSRPPNCERKCWGCEPCMAIQVPTTAETLGPQYANYEPEGWKCRCGSAFYNP